MTERELVRRILEAIIEWTLVDGVLKSPDHAKPKKLAEYGLRLVNPPTMKG